MRSSKKQAAAPSDIRSLKIDTKYRVNRWSETSIVPSIRLSGQWLEKLGFNPKQRVRVIMRSKLLIIQVEE